MAVPDTNTFTFLDVKNNVGGSPNDLVQAFANAIPEAFDPEYAGSKNSLLNFRNYNEIPPIKPFLISLSSARESRAESCAVGFTAATRYFKGYGIAPSGGDMIFSDSGGTTPFNGDNFFWKCRADDLSFYSIRIDTTGNVTAGAQPC